MVPAAVFRPMANKGNWKTAAPVRPVCTENLNPHILVMEAAQKRMRCDTSSSVNRP